jgi:alpha-beta hydrolase superfamily lysophospholipase
MDTNELLLRLPTALQAPVLTIGLRTGWAWHIPQLAVLKRWFRLSGVDEGALEWIVQHAHSWQMWIHFWLKEAERARVEAHRALDAGHIVTARARFHQSVLASALALWQVSGLEDRKRLYPQLLASFAAYGALTTPPIEKLDLAFDPAPLPAYLRLPRVPADGERLPVVVLVQGLDTIKEMDAFAEQPLLERGLATLTLDEPGVGEARLRGLRLNSIALLEAAAHAVCEAVKERPELDANRIGIFGWSFGGFVAPYFAAVEPRYSVLGTLGVMWEFPFPRSMARNPLYGPVLRLMTGIDDEQDRVTLLKQLTLAPVAQRISASSALLHGGDDRLLADGAHQLYAAISAEKILRMVPGADHGLTWHRDAELPLLWDWFADHLGTEASSMTSPEHLVRTAMRR